VLCVGSRKRAGSSRWCTATSKAPSRPRSGRSAEMAGLTETGSRLDACIDITTSLPGSTHLGTLSAPFTGAAVGPGTAARFAANSSVHPAVPASESAGKTLCVPTQVEAWTAPIDCGTCGSRHAPSPGVKTSPFSWASRRNALNAESSRRAPLLLGEEAGEISGVVEPKIVAHLGHRHVRVEERPLGLQDHPILHQA
jgi:hypothetical protein